MTTTCFGVKHGQHNNNIVAAVLGRLINHGQVVNYMGNVIIFFILVRLGGPLTMHHQ